ncbi:MAG: sugar phosphate isomerase/epimerase [Acidimicrobiia bacterium]|nr:sugar phosphate isomerase/epimerase [Acidimicrobiia bacterium]
MLLGTVAIEPNRWGGVDPSWTPTVAVSEHLDRIAAAGFDGLELWEGHALRARPGEADAIAGGPVPVIVFNSYAGFDEPDRTARDQAAATVRRFTSTGLKYNIGNDPSLTDTYIERISGWVEQLPGVRLLCECHEGISIAEDPAVAAQVFEAAGPPDRVQAIVHLGEDIELTRRRFEAYGERITHVHVNFLGQGAPPLRDIVDTVGDRVGRLQALGFDGTWTIEFTSGVGTDDDRAARLFASAIDDLAVLREVLA